MQVIVLYKGLGGGWEKATAGELVPEETRLRKQERSNRRTFPGRGDLTASRAGNAEELP